MMVSSPKITTVPVNFRTTPAQKDATEALAKARGVSLSQVLRAALNEHVTKASSGVSGATAESVVAEVAPMLAQQFDALADALSALNARLEALEARK